MADTSSGDGRGRADWVLHRAFANFWALPMAAALVGAISAYFMVEWDRGSLTAFLLAHDLSPVASSDTAKDWVGIAVGVNAALLTLYLSVTMLVLTVASSNLGVRLIDRWMDKRLVRVSLSGLALSLAFALMVQGSIDGSADLADTPLGSVAVAIALQIVNVAMLTVALHDLGRTIFVDRSIHVLALEAASGKLVLEGRQPFAGEWAVELLSDIDGYVEGNDIDALRRMMGDDPFRAQFAAAPGQHVMIGEPLLRLERPLGEVSRLSRLVPIGPYRSDAQGVVFRVRLLVEIACRALSPAINDFYTAMACADRLAQVLNAHGDRWVQADQMPVRADACTIELPGQDFHNLFNDPLAAFRQSACQYPSVAIRMIDNYVRLIARDDGPVASGDMRDFLLRHARELSEHAAEQATYEGDARDIREAFERGRRIACAEPVGDHRV